MMAFLLGCLLGSLCGVMLAAYVETKTKADVSRGNMVCHFAGKAYLMVEIKHSGPPVPEGE